MGVTPIYGFPYPALTDPPNGAAQIQALAEAVEADLAVTDSNIATINATGLTYAKFLGGQRRLANTAPVNTVETQCGSTGSRALPASSLIRVHLMAKFSVSVPNDDFLFRIRETNMVGTAVREVFTQRVSYNGVPYTFHMEYFYKTSVAETRTWVASVVRNIGTGNVEVEAGSVMGAWVEGASSLLVDV